MHVQWHILTAEAKDTEGVWSRHYSESHILILFAALQEIALFLSIWCKFHVTFLCKVPNIFITLPQSNLKLLSYEDLRHSYKKYSE